MMEINKSMALPKLARLSIYLGVRKNYDVRVFVGLPMKKDKKVFT